MDMAVLVQSGRVLVDFHFFVRFALIQSDKIDIHSVPGTVPFIAPIHHFPTHCSQRTNQLLHALQHLLPAIDCIVSGIIRMCNLPQSACSGPTVPSLTRCTCKLRGHKEDIAISSHVPFDELHHSVLSPLQLHDLCILLRVL